jgi:large subunit ribosomal protein L35
MYKLKTNRSAKKRFKITANGKIKRSSSKKRHLLEKKSPKAKRRLRGTEVLHERDVVHVIKLLPYGG